MVFIQTLPALTAIEDEHRRNASLEIFVYLAKMTEVMEAKVNTDSAIAVIQLLVRRYDRALDHFRLLENCNGDQVTVLEICSLLFCAQKLFSKYNGLKCHELVHLHSFFSAVGGVFSSTSTDQGEASLKPLKHLAELTQKGSKLNVDLARLLTIGAVHERIYPSENKNDTHQYTSFHAKGRYESDAKTPNRITLRFDGLYNTPIQAHLPEINHLNSTFQRCFDEDLTEFSTVSQLWLRVLPYAARTSPVQLPQHLLDRMSYNVVLRSRENLNRAYDLQFYLEEGGRKQYRIGRLVLMFQRPFDVVPLPSTNETRPVTYLFLRLFEAVSCPNIPSCVTCALGVKSRCVRLLSLLTSNTTDSFVVIRDTQIDRIVLMNRLYHHRSRNLWAHNLLLDTINFGDTRTFMKSGELYISHVPVVPAKIVKDTPKKGKRKKSL